MIFVFGSNLAGRHGKGAALCARNSHGAEYGVGVGRTGNAYAIPTKDERIRTLPLERIAKYVAEFLDYARAHPELEFEVTKIGCGLAGYREHDIKPMFAGAPMNCHLPDWWRSNTSVTFSLRATAALSLASRSKRLLGRWQLRRKNMGIEELEAAWNEKADKFNQWHELGLEEIVEFAQEKERDACAKTAEDFNTFPHALESVGVRIATEIRKRSNAIVSGLPRKGD